jgi:hypothetical protein
LRTFMILLVLNWARMKKLLHGTKLNDKFSNKVNCSDVPYRKKKSALKELSQIPQPYNKKIIEAIDEVALNPRPFVVKN